MMDKLRRAFGIKAEEEIVAEVNEQPTVKEARDHLARADAVLDELQQLERMPPPRGRMRAKHVR